jgi:hypothetical protein
MMLWSVVCFVDVKSRICDILWLGVYERRKGKKDLELECICTLC